MSKLSNAVKKIVKHKDFKWLVLIQVGVLMIVAVLFLIMPKPISRYETHSERVYSPSFRMDTYKTGKFNSRIASDIIIFFEDKEYIYDNIKNRNPAPDTPVIVQLGEEEYLDITYIVQNGKHRIVELHGEKKVYYTIEDHLSGDNVDAVARIVIVIFFELAYVFIAIAIIDEIIHGTGRFKPIRRLLKKHPTEKHVYTDEENEFSPYKQKLLDKEQEEEASDS